MQLRVLASAVKDWVWVRQTRGEVSSVKPGAYSTLGAHGAQNRQNGKDKMFDTHLHSRHLRVDHNMNNYQATDCTEYKIELGF